MYIGGHSVSSDVRYSSQQEKSKYYIPKSHCCHGNTKDCCHEFSVAMNSVFIQTFMQGFFRILGDGIRVH